MTAARFELYAVVQRGGSRSRAPTPGAVTWRLLSGNNRDLARAAAGFPDVTTCVAALGLLRAGLDTATVSVSSPDGRARWTWRLGLPGPDADGRPAPPVGVAVSSRAYQRRVQAEAAAAVFVGLAAGAPVTESLRLVAL